MPKKRTPCSHLNTVVLLVQYLPNSIGAEVVAHDIPDFLPDPHFTLAIVAILSVNLNDGLIIYIYILTDFG